MLEIATLDQIRIILTIIMLGIATASDIKKREISDLIWIVFGAIGACLIPFAGNPNDELLKIAISMIVAPIAIIIWRFGLFGGADAFALIAVAVLAPSITLTENVVTPFSVLTNAVIFSVVPMFINVIRNTVLLARRKDIFNGFDETVGRKVFAMFIGYRASNPRFGFSIEQKIGNYKKLNLSLQHAEHAVFCDKKDTWITPGIPYMIFIFAAFIVQLIYGDIIFNTFKVLG
jgi:preflagellin peptidase FlaK